MKDTETNVEYSQEYLLETIKILREALVDYESLEHKFSLAETTIMVHREMFKMLKVNFEKVTKERDEALIILASLQKAASDIGPLLHGLNCRGENGIGLGYECTCGASAEREALDAALALTTAPQVVITGEMRASVLREAADLCGGQAAEDESRAAEYERQNHAPGYMSTHRAASVRDAERRLRTLAEEAEKKSVSLCTPEMLKEAISAGQDDQRRVIKALQRPKK